MSSFLISLSILLFFSINVNLSFSQNDSGKTKIGPDELLKPGVGNYYNFSDKNKVNIEVVVIGGIGGGKYLIPEGTKIFDFLIMVGGAGPQFVDDIKIVRFKSDSPLKGRQVIEVNFSDLYGDTEEILKSQPNPVLRPGDMIIVPQPKITMSVWDYASTFLGYISIILSFYFLYDQYIRR